MLDSPATAAPWQVARDLPTPLRRGDRVLVVSAHPDDETIGAGRLLAEHDGPVAALTLTLGERCVPALPAEPMARRRREEWGTALVALGASVADDATRWPDGELADHVDAVAAFLTRLAGEADVLVTTWRHDPHPDHRAAGDAAARAAGATGVRLVEFPVWAPYWLTRPAVLETGYEPAHVRSSHTAGRARERALAAYASQTGTLVDGVDPVVPAAMLERHPEQIVMCPR